MKTRRVPLESLSNAVQRKGDLLIVSASYEERCLAIARALDRGLLGSVVICENINHKDLHRGNAENLSMILGRKAILAGLSTVDPLMTADSLSSALGPNAEDDEIRILVDISTFTHEGLLILLRYLDISRSLRNVCFLYCTAADYSVREVGTEKWLSKGVGEVRSVLGYPGRVLPSNPLHLIVLVGLESERAVELIGRYEPSQISLGYGEDDEELSVITRDISGRGFEKVRAIFKEARRFEFPCFDPLGTQVAVKRQIDLFPEHGIIVAPMNTKISAVGVGMLASSLDYIQLCYAQALVYNYLGYSNPGDQAVVLECRQ